MRARPRPTGQAKPIPVQVCPDAIACSTLRSGSLYGGGFKAPVHIGRLPVSKGDVLYFVVDDYNDESCYCAKPVDFRVAITQLP